MCARVRGRPGGRPVNPERRVARWRRMVNRWRLVTAGALALFSRRHPPAGRPRRPRRRRFSRLASRSTPSKAYPTFPSTLLFSRPACSFPPRPLFRFPVSRARARVCAGPKPSFSSFARPPAIGASTYAQLSREVLYGSPKRNSTMPRDGLPPRGGGAIAPELSNAPGALCNLCFRLKYKTLILRGFPGKWPPGLAVHRFGVLGLCPL